MQTISLKEMLPGVSDSLIKASKIKFKISKMLYQKRKQMNMSQKEFAKFMGVTQGMVSKWESFEYNFTIESLCEVFEKIDIDFNIEINNEIEEYKKIGFVEKPYAAYSNGLVGWSQNLSPEIVKAG